MQERRRTLREKVIYGGIAEIEATGTSRECIVRNISETGANLSFRDILRLPKNQLSLTIAKKGRRFDARVIWTNGSVLGVTFCGEQPQKPVAAEIEEALRLSEKKQRRLQHQIRLLTGEA